MPKWSDVLGRVIPWLELSRIKAADAVIRETACATTAEQTGMSEYIEAQADYLEGKAKVNGFSRQLAEGFQRRISGGE